MNIKGLIYCSGRGRSFYSQEIFEEQKTDETTRSRKEKKER